MSCHSSEEDFVALVVEMERLHIVHFTSECTGSNRGARILGGSLENLILHFGFILQHEAYQIGRRSNWIPIVHATSPM